MSTLTTFVLYESLINFRVEKAVRKRSTCSTIELIPNREIQTRIDTRIVIEDEITSSHHHRCKVYEDRRNRPLLFVSRSDTRKPSGRRSELVSRLECTPPVIISCLAGQTTARAPPCLKRPNCRPRICSANTFSTPSATNTFPCPPRHVSTTRPRRHSCRPGIAPERELTFRPGTAIIVVTRFRFFVCPRNSTSPPPSPLPISPPSPVFPCRAPSRFAVPIRYQAKSFHQEMDADVGDARRKDLDPRHEVSIDVATDEAVLGYFDSWKFRFQVLFLLFQSSRDQFFSKHSPRCVIYLSHLRYGYFKMEQRYIHLYGYLRIPTYSVGSFRALGPV